MTAIFLREFKSYFITPLGYVFIGVYLLFSGAFFYLFTLTGAGFGSDMGTVDFSTMFTLMFFVLMVTIPLLTMRLLSEERKSKTDQLLLTAPVSLTSLVFAKFAAAFCIFLLSTAIMPVYGVVLGFFTDSLNWWTLLGNVAGLVLLGAVYTAAGLFISSLTENQMVAAVISVFVNISFLLTNLAAMHVPVRPVADAMKAVSLLERYDRFTIGLFEPENVLFFASIVTVFLFLTVRVLEKRRWA
ncbi:MAG: ABC transporter permease [Oscillospiraceae bacterium]|nr:ABC transporter permease [Oscillospiraceae bacterium]